MTYRFLQEKGPPQGPIEVGGRLLSFSRPLLMGILNTTPDSFSDGGRFSNHQEAIETGLAMVEAGADILDIGGESTRPGAEPVPLDEELCRVLPVVEGIRKHSPVFLSIDTYKAEVAREAVRAGAEIVNDISGLGFDPAMAETVANLDAALVIMHIQKTPKTMQEDIAYENLLAEIETYFQERVDYALSKGVQKGRIILDPGFGFGKTVDQNYELLRNLPRLARLGHPLLVGTSRKSMIGKILNKPPLERTFGTAATVTAAVMGGAHIHRVHDVREMKDVLAISEKIIAADSHTGSFP